MIKTITIKKIFALLFLSLCMFSCLKDDNTVKKEALTKKYSDMVKALDKKDMNWFRKNSVKELNISSLENILFEDSISLRTFIKEKDKSEYTLKFFYKVADSFSGYQNTGYYIIRLEQYAPKYFYIHLIYKRNKWLIDKIEIMPQVN